jgi:predicted nucleic acid-binding protein
VRSVFIDTSGFYALMVAEDVNHSRAVELFSIAEREKWGLVTTNAVMFEAYALFLHRARAGREAVIRFLDAVQSDTYELERIRDDDEAKAIALLLTHDDKMYSLCDALSFVVMERLRVREAISFDQDFRSYGRFTIL